MRRTGSARLQVISIKLRPVQVNYFTSQGQTSSFDLALIVLIGSCFRICWLLAV